MAIFILHWDNWRSHFDEISKSDRINKFEPENYREYQVQKLDHEYEPHKALLAEFFRVIR